MIDWISDQVSLLWDKFFVQTEITDVFRLMGELWNAIPSFVRYIFLGVFSVAVTLSIIKMII